MAAGDQAAEARALRLLADRPRPRVARRRHRARAARPAPRPADRLAGAGSGHARARGLRRGDPPGERAAGQRVAPHRRRVARARAQRVPGLAADGRDPAGQLHGLPRHGARRALRPVDRRRGVGARLLPAREPRAQDGPLRLPHRLRGLAADARGRRCRGAPDRRLQRRDDRADRALPARARPRDLRRRPRGRRAARLRRRPAGDRPVGGRALRLQRLRPGSRRARAGRPRRAARRARLRARRGRVRGHRRRLGRRHGAAAPRHRRPPRSFARACPGCA